MFLKLKFVSNSCGILANRGIRYKSYSIIYFSSSDSNLLIMAATVLIKLTTVFVKLYVIVFMIENDYIIFMQTDNLIFFVIKRL